MNKQINKYDCWQKNSYCSTCVFFIHDQCFFLCILFHFSFIWLYVYSFAINSMVHCRSAFEQGASGISYYCTPPVSLLLHTTWSIAGVPSSRALLGFSITALLLFFHHHSHCVAAKPKKNALRECHLIRSGPGVSGLPYYRTPPLCVSDEIEVLAGWPHNNNKNREERCSVTLKSSIEYICPRGAGGRRHLEHSTHRISRSMPHSVWCWSRGARCWRQRALWATCHLCNSRHDNNNQHSDNDAQVRDPSQVCYTVGHFNRNVHGKLARGGHGCCQQVINKAVADASDAPTGFHLAWVHNVALANAAFVTLTQVVSGPVSNTFSNAWNWRSLAQASMIGAVTTPAKSIRREAARGVSPAAAAHHPKLEFPRISVFSGIFRVPQSVLPLLSRLLQSVTFHAF